MTPPDPDPARLLVPALRWREGSGFAHETATIAQALDEGVGGFMVFGGNPPAVARLVHDLRRRSPHPLLVGADLERGAGQQFPGLRSLPPAGALGSLDDAGVAWSAGWATARDARSLGVDWIFAPVADLDVEARNPIVGSRSFGADPHRVAVAVSAWIRGCRTGGGIPCVKHFPGHGRTRVDSHVDLPVVEADRAALARDLVPFAAAVASGVPSVMTAHVSYPALDPAGPPATRSRPIVHGLLRRALGFEGAVVSDALVMEGFAARSGREPPPATGPDAGREGRAAVEAIRAGVDLLLYPRDLESTAAALRTGVAEGRLSPDRLAEALERRRALLERRSAPPLARPAGDLHPSLVVARELAAEAGIDDTAHELARRTLGIPDGIQTRSSFPRVALLIVDDDVGGPYPPPSRGPLVRALEAAGVAVDVREAPGEGDGGARSDAGSSSSSQEGAEGSDGDGVARWVAVFAEPRGWKGRAGLSTRARRQIRRAAPGADLLLLFGHPRLRAELPDDPPVVVAWGGEALMQEAAVHALTAGAVDGEGA